MNPANLEPLLPVLEAVARLIEAAGGRGLVMGGVAVSLAGRPRFTADVDALVILADDQLESFLANAVALGLAPRVDEPLGFARSRRVLLLRHRETGIGVDVSLGMLPFEGEAVARARTIRVGALDLRIPSVEDLIVFKAVAHRPKDLEDIRGLVATAPKMDRRRIERWVRDFARVLEMPEIWNDLRPLLKPRPHRK